MRSTQRPSPSTDRGAGASTPSTAPQSLVGENIQLDHDASVDEGTPMLEALGLGRELVPSDPPEAAAGPPTTVAAYVDLLERSGNATHTYRKLALAAHPDKPGGSREAWDALSEAYTRVCGDSESDHEVREGDESAIEGPLPLTNGEEGLPAPEPQGLLEAPEPLLMLEAPPERSVMDDYVGARDAYQDNLSRLLREDGEKRRLEREAEEQQRAAEREAERARKEKAQREAEEARQREEEARRANEESLAELDSAFKALGPAYKSLTVKPDGLDADLKSVLAAIKKAGKAGTAADQKADLLQRIQGLSSRIASQASLASDEASARQDLTQVLETLSGRTESFAARVDRASALTEVELSWDDTARATLEGARDRLKAQGDEITRRREALDAHVQALEANPQLDRTRLEAARAALASEGDLSTLGAVDGDVSGLGDALKVFRRDALNTKKLALVEAAHLGDKKLSPKRKARFEAWISNQAPKIKVSKADFEALIAEELQAQYKVNKSQWLDLLGLQPWGKLWGDDSVGKVGSYNVHASLYKDVMASVVMVDSTAANDAKDQLLGSGTSGFHVTMEVFGKFGDGGHNPHSYRNGDTRKGGYPGSDWVSSAKGTFQALRDDQVAAKEALIETTVDAKASNLEPA